MTAVWKKLRFILSVRSDFDMTDSLSVAVRAFASSMLMSVSDHTETLVLVRSPKLSSVEPDKNLEWGNSHE